MAVEYSPSLEQFRGLARKGNLVPVYRELSADLDTPVSVFLKLGQEAPTFLLESVEGGERLARYSFLGFGDALDQYLLRHPDVIVSQGFESAVIDLGNPYITRGHLQCAASEAPVREDDAAIVRPDPLVVRAPVGQGVAHAFHGRNDRRHRDRVDSGHDPKRLLPRRCHQPASDGRPERHLAHLLYYVPERRGLDLDLGRCVRSLGLQGEPHRAHQREGHGQQDDGRETGAPCQPLGGNTHGG